VRSTAIRDTHYQVRRRLVLGPRGGRLGLALGLALAACSRPAAPPSPADAASAEAVAAAGATVHFSRLRALLPDRLLDFEGERPTASTSQYGRVAVSEAERSYRQGERVASVRIIDTNLQTGGPVPAQSWETEAALHRPLEADGAVGYVEFDKASRAGKADLVVAERFLVTLKLEPARGADEVERLARALQLSRLAALARLDAGAP